MDSDKEKIIDDLHDAVKRYVEHHGGTAVIGGNVELIQYPTDAKFNYRIAIRITGKPPENHGEGGG